MTTGTKRLYCPETGVVEEYLLTVDAEVRIVAKFEHDGIVSKHVFPATMTLEEINAQFDLINSQQVPPTPEPEPMPEPTPEPLPVPEPTPEPTPEPVPPVPSDVDIMVDKVKDLVGQADSLLTQISDSPVVTVEDQEVLMQVRSHIEQAKTLLGQISDTPVSSGSTEPVEGGTPTGEPTFPMVNP